jgi:siroheme synthase-like protein
MNFLPVSVNISGKRLLIIGGGKVAHHKASILSRFTDEATVISPSFHEGFASLPFKRITKEYEKTDLAGAFLIYICTGDRELNAAIKADAADLGILASVCDNPALCDFISPAIYKKDNITVAVSSNGLDVKRAIETRDRIMNYEL